MQSVHNTLVKDDGAGGKQRHTVGVRPAAATVAVRGARRAAQIIVLLHQRHTEAAIIATRRARAGLGRASMNGVRLAVDVLGADKLRCTLDADYKSWLAQAGGFPAVSSSQSGSVTAEVVTLGTIAAPTKDAAAKKAAMERNFMVRYGRGY